MLIGGKSFPGKTMTTGLWEINEIRLADSGLQLHVSATDHLSPSPGQYFLVFAPGMNEPLATPLFIADKSNGEWLLAGQIPPYWQPGTRLSWRGPLGHGFNLPLAARRVALAAWEHPATSLPALVGPALTQGASVVWYSSHLPEWLPPSVEVLPPESLPEVWDWADYLALECGTDHLPQLAKTLNISPSYRSGCTTEVLLHTPLTCGGLGECGVCAVRTSHGFKFACKDGPVFNLEQLELAA